MREIAHGGCTDTVREYALKVDSGRKIPCRAGESKGRRRHTRQSQPHATQEQIHTNFVELSPCASSKPLHKAFIGCGAAAGDACGKDRKHWALRPQKPFRLIRDGEVRELGIFISNTYSLHCHHQNDSALRWAVG